MPRPQSERLRLPTKHPPKGLRQEQKLLVQKARRVSRRIESKRRVMAPELSRLLQVGATYSLDKETLVAIADKELTPINREKGRARSL